MNQFITAMYGVIRHLRSPLSPISMVGGIFAGFIYRTPAEIICLTCVLIVGALDWITGVSASFKEGLPISSQRMRQAIPKWIGYLAFICLIIVTGQLLTAEGLPIKSSVPLCSGLALIFGIEGHSVLENVTRLTGIRSKWLDRILNGLADSGEAQALPSKEFGK